MSPRRCVPLALVALLSIGGASCSTVGDQVGEVRASAERASESVRFCLSLARAAAAMEGSSPDTAADAVEEVLVHAPTDVRDDARTIVERIRDAEDGGEALDDPQVLEAIERLQERTRSLCDPS